MQQIYLQDIFQIYLFDLLPLKVPGFQKNAAVVGHGYNVMSLNFMKFFNEKIIKISILAS